MTFTVQVWRVPKDTLPTGTFTLGPARLPDGAVLLGAVEAPGDGRDRALLNAVDAANALWPDWTHLTEGHPAPLED